LEYEIGVGRRRGESGEGARESGGKVRNVAKVDKYNFLRRYPGETVFPWMRAGRSLHGPGLCFPNLHHFTACFDGLRLLLRLEEPFNPQVVCRRQFFNTSCTFLNLLVDRHNTDNLSILCCELSFPALSRPFFVTSPPDRLPEQRFSERRFVF
jgi:hypothetical protein